MAHWSRRNFLKLSTAATGGALTLRSWPAWASNGRIVVDPPLSLFDYSEVQIEGPLRDQFDHNHQLFLGMSEDALLKPFREREGLPAPGPDMGGWYDNSPDFNPHGNFHGFIPGHSFGQYLSGLSRAYAITGSKPTQEKVHRLVQGCAATISPEGKFYKDYHLPAYTYDKTSCGLQDAAVFAADPVAMDALWQATQAALRYLPDKAVDRMEEEKRPHKDDAFGWDESYTLPENLFLAYQRSGDSRYRDLAVRYIAHYYFGPLAEDQNVLPGRHAYSHMNALASAMQSYLVLGDETYLRAARNGLRMIQEQSYATGGWGPDEAFVVPGTGMLANSVEKVHHSFETPCGSYGHFKVTRYLLRVTRDSRYGDSMEQVLYNTIAGAKPTQPDGRTFYYSDYHTPGNKFFHQDRWPCCSGTFTQVTADYGISSYLCSADGVYVNLFLPSRLTWKQGSTRCTIIQKTDYPTANTTELRFELQRPERFTVYLRVPAWAGSKTEVRVNGHRVSEQVVPGQFLALKRTWKGDDRIEFEMEMPLRLFPVDTENRGTVALMRGPLAMFAVGNVPEHFNRKDLLAAVPVAENSSDWKVQTETGSVTFRPFAAIGDEEYRFYQKVQG